MRRTLLLATLFTMVMFMAPDCIAQTGHRSFILRIDGNDVAVNLPKEVPDMKDARHIGERCFDARLCVDHYNINEGETLIISFWHHKGVVIGFVLHDLAQDVAKHTAWLYAADTPAWATGEEFNAKLTELYQGG